MPGVITRRRRLDDGRAVGEMTAADDASYYDLDGMDTGGEVEGARSTARERQEALLKEFESRRRLRATHAPTDDAQVRAMLRRYEEPVTLFGERQAERRERLRGILAALDARDGGELETSGDVAGGGAVVVDASGVGAYQKEIFYTEGTDGLLQARVDLAEFSLPRAAKRVAEQKAKRGERGGDERRAMDDIVLSTSAFTAQCSEIGDVTRPLCAVRFYDQGKRAVSASWSGEVRAWTCDAAAGKLSSNLVIKATEHRITGLDAYHDGCAIATAHADGTAAIWSADGERRRELKGHASRCGKIAFHPRDGGRYVATAGFDATWRLWHTETGEELLCQEGHSREVYDVGFHPDGSLAASVGLDAIGRVWDLRLGKSISVLRGHVKQILSVDFAPNGYHIITGSDDRTVRVWDLRKNAACAYTLASHSALVSCVRYEKTATHGAFFSSCSYDGTVCIYSGSDFALNTRLSASSSSSSSMNKLTSVDVAGDALVACGFDKTLKMYTK